MIKMKMKLAGAIIPAANGGATVTLVAVDGDSGSDANAACASFHASIFDPAIVPRLSLGDTFDVTLEPADELRTDAWQREQAEKNKDLVPPAPQGDAV